MPDKNLRPDDPLEWLKRAKSSLTKAKVLNGNKEIYLEDLCFDLQQAAEKAVKAVLIYYKIKFPKSHDLADLMSMLETNRHSVPEEIKRAAELTEYAVETRYPGWIEPVVQTEYEEAIEIAEKVLNWAESLIK
ncbi:MAG: HEPN domain-containing protein [bacterium]